MNYTSTEQIRLKHMAVSTLNANLIAHYDARIKVIQSLTQLTSEERAVLTDHAIQSRKAAQADATRAIEWLKADDGYTPNALLEYDIMESLANLLLGEKLPLHVLDGFCNLLPASTTVTKRHLAFMARAWMRSTLHIDPSPIRNRVWLECERAYEKFQRLSAQ